MTHDAWDDLKKAIELFSQHPGSKISPFHCEHDELWVMCDPTEFTEEELEDLKELGFIVSEDSFMSHRFGSS